MTKHVPPMIREGLNFNTVLLTLVLGLSGWTLKKVSDLGESQARSETRIDHLFTQMQQLDARVSSTANELHRHQLNTRQ